MPGGGFHKITGQSIPSNPGVFPGRTEGKQDEMALQLQTRYPSC